MLTFIGTPTTEKGVFHGVGKGVLTTTGDGGEPEMISYTGEGIRRLDSSGGMKWRGGVFESEIDAAGNFSEKIWEWK